MLRSLLLAVPVVMASLEQPTSPTECTTANAGRCDCAQSAQPFSPFHNAKTYTWYVSGEQRCVTTYVPEAGATLNNTNITGVDRHVNGTNGGHPVIFDLNCYASDRLMGFGRETIDVAARFGVAFVYVSTPGGGWTWNESVADDKSPLPCSEDAAGTDYTYFKDIFAWLETQSSFDMSKTYTYGFSQNGMGSAYLGACFPDKVTGHWMGGAGLYSHNVAGNPGGPVPPNKACQQSDCEYWPAFPCHDDSKHLSQACIQFYSNDPVTVDQRDPASGDRTKGHGYYVFDRIGTEGNDARMMSFSPNEAAGIKGSHHDPENKWDWLMACFGGITEQCSSSCESALISCVKSSSGSNVDAYATCITSTTVSSGKCASGCTPTFKMVSASEEPVLSVTKGAVFGQPAKVQSKPSTSICSS